MRNPRVWRNAALAFAISGAVAGLMLWRVGDALSNGATAALACYALTAVLFGGFSAWARHGDWRAQSALAGGAGLLATWQVDAYAWRDFRAMHERLQAEPDARASELNLRDEIPDEGITVRIGRTAIDVDGSVHHLPARGTPEVQQAVLFESRVTPSFITLDLKYPGGGTGASGVPRSPVYTVLRVPVTRAAMSAARTVVSHFNGDQAGTPDLFHGTGDGTDAEDLSRCWSCGFETHKFLSECPRCNSSLQSRRWARRFGFGLTLCGLFISVLMGVVLANMLPTLRHPGETVDGTRFNGTAAQAAMVFGLMAVVLAFGLTALAYGMWQMRTGKRNLRVAYVMVAAFMGLLLLARWIRRALCATRQFFEISHNQDLLVTASIAILFSATIMGVLGAGHLVLTYVGPKLLPRDRALRSTMEAVSPVITTQTTMWRCWIGFNASHSLGLLLFALVYGYLAVEPSGLLFSSLFLQELGVCALLAYVVMSRRYFFVSPLFGTGLALVLFCAGLVLARLG